MTNKNKNKNKKIKTNKNKKYPHYTYVQKDNAAVRFRYRRDICTVEIYVRKHETTLTCRDQQQQFCREKTFNFLLNNI